MSFWQGRSKRKASGGKYLALRKKKAREIGRDPLFAKLGDSEEKITLRTRGGNLRTSMKKVKFASLSEKGKARKVEIKRLAENPASRHFVRQNIITKGALIETSEGMAKVTSRPTKDGTVNAVLVKAK